MKVIDTLKGCHTSRIIAGLLSYANGNMERALVSLDTGIGPIWFLPAMIFTSFMAYILIKNLREHSIILMGSGLFVSIVGGVIGKRVLLPFGIDNGSALVLFFIMGYLFNQNLKKGVASSYIGFIIFVCGEVATQFIGIQSFASRIYPKFPVCFAVSLVTTVGFFVWIKSSYWLMIDGRKKINSRGVVVRWEKLVEFIGKNSLMALFFHTLEFEYLLDLWTEVQICNVAILNQLLHGCISCVINFLILIVYVKAKEQIKNFGGVRT
jgi:fucose 4-O-acetylase-like acetyltransferase